MRLPELSGIGAFGQFGGAARDVAAGERAVPEHVAQAVAELVADLGDAVVGRAAIGAGIAAVLDERDLCVGRPEDMVAAFVHRRVEHPLCMVGDIRVCCLQVRV